MLRKRGDVVIEFDGFVDGDGACFKKILKSANEVETTISDGETNQFIVKNGNGDLSIAPLKYYAVEQLENAGALLEGCDETFNMS